MRAGGLSLFDDEDAGRAEAKCTGLRNFCAGHDVECGFTPGEWAAFVRCARARLEDGSGLHNEYEAKRAPHPIPQSEIEQTLTESAEPISYRHWGRARIGIWRRETGVLLALAPCPVSGELALYNALDYEDLRDPERCGEMEDVRWLMKS